MRLSYTITVGAILVVGGWILAARLLASPEPTETLPLSHVSPDVIAASAPTHVTFSTSLPELIYADLRRPKLQVYDAVLQSWLTIHALKDSGWYEDPVGKDRSFNLRVLVLDNGSSTQISLLRPFKKTGPERVAEVKSPASFRLFARRKWSRERFISPSFVVPTVESSAVTFGGVADESLASIIVPGTFDVVDGSNPYKVQLHRTGPNGYAMSVFVYSNEKRFSAEEWITSCILLAYRECGILESDDPKTLDDYERRTGRDLGAEPVQVAGLTGLKVLIQDPEGVNIVVVLDDALKNRFFDFYIAPVDAHQERFFLSDLPEALQIVESLQP